MSEFQLPIPGIVSKDTTSTDGCPLKLECGLSGECPRSWISFDTLDSPPALAVQAFDIDHEGDGVANNWPMVVCDASGAEHKQHGLSIDDRQKLAILARLVTSGVVWHDTLKSAAETLPKAPWAPLFKKVYAILDNEERDLDRIFHASRLVDDAARKALS